MTDSIHALSHDHHDINARALAVGALVRELRSDESGVDELVVALGELREHLFLHFAREEEGLFPFVAEAMPELAGRMRELAIAHDTICGALARAVHLAESSHGHVELAPTYERFELAYAIHARLEIALLDEVATRLDPAQRARVAALIDGL